MTGGVAYAILRSVRHEDCVGLRPFGCQRSETYRGGTTGRHTPASLPSVQESDHV